MKQDADIQYSALLHPQFTLMCHITVLVKPVQRSVTTVFVKLVQLLIKVNYACIKVHCVGCQDLVSILFGIPNFTCFSLKFFQYVLTFILLHDEIVDTFMLILCSFIFRFCIIKLLILSSLYILFIFRNTFIQLHVSVTLYRKRND